MADVNAWLDEIERVEYDDASYQEVVRQEEAMMRAAGMLGAEEHLLVEALPQPSMQLTAALPPPITARLQFQAGNPAALIEWFNDGADGQINWCEHGDFEDCVAVASAHLDDPEGFCNVRHQDVCGGPPGSEGKASIEPITLRGTPWEFYSEDQERDEIGRFGPGGGGSTGAEERSVGGHAMSPKEEKAARSTIETRMNNALGTIGRQPNEGIAQYGFRMANGREMETNPEWVAAFARSPEGRAQTETIMSALNGGLSPESEQMFWPTLHDNDDGRLSVTLGDARSELMRDMTSQGLVARTESVEMRADRMLRGDVLVRSDGSRAAVDYVTPTWMKDTGTTKQYVLTNDGRLDKMGKSTSVTVEREYPRRAGTAGYRGTPFEFYSEDQERDDAGRFGPGGGATTKDTTPAGVQDVVKAAAEQSIIDRVAAEGGITIQPLTGEIPTTGFIVGVHADVPSITPSAEFYGGAGVDEIDRFLADNAAAFDDDNVYLGVWDDEDHGEVAIDVVVQVATEQAGIAMGRANDQQSIYDVANKRVIEVGGTGGRS